MLPVVRGTATAIVFHRCPVELAPSSRRTLRILRDHATPCRSVDACRYQVLVAAEVADALTATGSHTVCDRANAPTPDPRAGGDGTPLTGPVDLFPSCVSTVITAGQLHSRTMVASPSTGLLADHSEQRTARLTSAGGLLQKDTAVAVEMGVSGG